MQYSDNNSQQEQQPSAQSHDYDDEQEEESALGEVLQKLETIKIFKGSWIYAEMIRLLNEQYQDLFNKAIKDTNRDTRSDRIEQMKGVAYATGIIDIIEQDLEQQLGENHE